MPAAPVSAAVAAAVGTAASIYQGERSASQARKAQDQQQKAAARQEWQADQEFNRANQKSPDSQAILAAQQQSGQGGAGSTMLTQGTDLGALKLGKTTLLGG